MEMTPHAESAYRIVVASPWERPLGRLWAFGLRDPLPDIPVPLREGEQEAVIPLGNLLAERYDAARYDYRIDYDQPPPEPPLPDEEVEWLREWLEARRQQEAREAVDGARPESAASPAADDRIDPATSHGVSSPSGKA